MNAREEDAVIRRALDARIGPMDCDETRICETVSLSRAAYRAHEARLPLKDWEFVFQQAGYVRKRWWLLQGLTLALLWLALRFGGSANEMRRFVGVLAPTFGMLALPELWKNRSNNAMEVECTARFALRQVYAARLLLFGMVDLIWLSLFFAAASLGTRAELGALILQFFVPMNIACCICFATLRWRGFGSEGMAVLACGLWVAVWVLVVLDNGLYDRISAPAWCALLALSALGLLRGAAKLCAQNFENREGMAQWN